MSNDVLNAHIAYGEPCGEDAELSVLADWAGGLLLKDIPKAVYLVEEITECGNGKPQSTIIKAFSSKNKANAFIKERELYKDMILNSRCPVDGPEDEMTDAELTVVEQWENEVSNAECDDVSYCIIVMEVE